MLVTLALVVLASSIVILFSDEFSRLFKKMFALKGGKILIPLIAASWLVAHYEFWVWWGIMYVRELVRYYVNFLVQKMPFHFEAQSVIWIILLTMLSVVPVLILEFRSQRERHKSYQYPYITSGLIWIFCAVLLLPI